MKKLYLLYVLMVFSCGSVTAQLAGENFTALRINEFRQANVNHTLSSDYYLTSGRFKSEIPVDYLQKSKSQKTWAWILTGAGVGIITVGLLTQNYVDAFSSTADEKNSASPVVYAVGGGFIAGGIVLFAASSKNKKKASRISGILKMERTFVSQQHPATINIYPAAGLRKSLCW